MARFLTVLLEVPIEPDELTLVHTEFSPEFLADKASVFDIHVRHSARHEKFNIEMQMSDQKNRDITRRILFYWGKGYIEDLKTKENYDALPRMVSIVIADFDIFEWSDAEKFHGAFRILEQDEGVLFSDALEIQRRGAPQAETPAR